MQFTESVRLGLIKVRVDITHTFIGDLCLTLIAPSGTSVVLHNRNGGSADKIKSTFDMTSTPGLSMLSGQSLQGTWTLLVQDQAAADVGVLNLWELEITPTQESVVELTESPAVTIPDNSPNGIERLLTTNASGQVKSVEVSVDITHTFIGDLEVKLITPDGTTIPLHHQTGGSADNIIKTYNEANPRPYSTYVGSR